MTQTLAPPRVRRAQASIAPTLAFLARYETWMARSRPTDCDFALGNPQDMPMSGFVTALRDATEPQRPDWYAYKMSTASARDVVRRSLAERTGAAYDPEDIILTNGATGALLVTLNALLGEGDEVVYNTPPWFFYESMIANTGARPVAVPVVADTFDLHLGALADAITDRTRLVIVNSPNNPTGKVYSRATLEGLADLLTTASRRIGRPIYLISDEAYRAVVFDDREYVSPTTVYDASIMIYTYGKTLLTPGQRLGYIALTPGLEQRAELRTLLTSSQIVCGWAVSSALMQHAIAGIEGLALDVPALQARRNRFVAGLRRCGYDVHAPEGAFYVTPKTPIDDDSRFADELATEGVYCLPGSIVHMPGHLRASLTASDEMIDRSLPVFDRVRRRHAGSR